jgi:addiction module RelE/StbE family toxin
VLILRVEWTHPALADLIEAQAYIAEESPRAAKMIGQRIWDASQLLEDNPYSGREGHVIDTRELVVVRTPYLLVYGINLDKQQVEILHVYHGRQNWQASADE